jgi:hypothetical protein
MVFDMLLRDLYEARTDPQMLATRAARRWGTKRDYGNSFDKVKLAGHLPLPYDHEKSEQAVEVWMDYWRDVREKNGNPKGPELRKLMNSLYKPKTFAIADLQATQPYVRTDDPKKLQASITNANPDHIRILTLGSDHYLIDGHHAVLAARLRGEKSVTGYHLNLNKIKGHQK